MSILTVEYLTHGFGDRAIFSDVSFRLLRGEHIGLVGANGEGKSTFFNIVTGHLTPDEGKIEWAKNVRIGYLDQHTVLEKGMTIRDVLNRKALPGILAAFGFGFARAFGETMAVLMVVGNVVMIPSGLFDPGYPLPALIANSFGELGSIPEIDSALMFAALILLVVVLVFNATLRWLIIRVEKY